MSEERILGGLQRMIRLAGVASGGGIVEGIGDDCAIFRQRGATEDLVFTTDMMHEDVHFLPDAAAGRVGEKALARSLSDIAAMGAKPLFCLVSIALPPKRELWLQKFYAGLLRVARKYSVVVAGGDLACSERVSCDVMACGAVARGKAMLRRAAREGDVIYVSGALGAAAAQVARGRLYVPKPRIAEGAALLAAGVKCCMDLSDGLSIDLARLCAASGIRAEIDAVPAAHGATEEQALHGGEDYELLFTAHPDVRVKGIAIGRTRRGSGIFHRGQKLAALGYDHFSNRI